MADYRLYLMDDDGHILRGIDLAAPDDKEAFELVRLRDDPGDVELWCGTRKVASIPKGGPIVLAQSSLDQSPA
jgi:hypothetical protein